MGGGAWPFLVGGVICLVNSVNERDLSLLNSFLFFRNCKLLRGTTCETTERKLEAITGL